MPRPLNKARAILSSEKEYRTEEVTRPTNGNLVALLRFNKKTAEKENKRKKI